MANINQYNACVQNEFKLMIFVAKKGLALCFRKIIQVKTTLWVVKGTPLLEFPMANFYIHIVIICETRSTVKGDDENIVLFLENTTYTNIKKKKQSENKNY